MTDLGRGLDAAIRGAALAATIWLVPAVVPCAAAEVACVVGSDRCPVRLYFHGRFDRITVHGRLTPERRRYSYLFKARAGQRLTWAFDGPIVRTLIRHPTGRSDGPGLPETIRLPGTGTYVFTVSSNLMAEDIFGPFRLTFRIR